MRDQLSERRLAENQVIFRQKNENITHGLEAIKLAAKSEGHDVIAQNVEENQNIPLHFYCECSDENCRKRIVLTPSEYKELHQNSSQFVLLPGHNVAEIERIVFNNEKLIVVEKYATPPGNADKLNRTDVDNS